MSNFYTIVDLFESYNEKQSFACLICVFENSPLYRTRLSQGR